jgi:hypothetical protein
MHADVSCRYLTVRSTPITAETRVHAVVNGAGRVADGDLLGTCVAVSLVRDEAARLPSSVTLSGTSRFVWRNLASESLTGDPNGARDLPW